MAASNINRVIITGNLTADPELRSLPSGTSVCKLRVACNTRRKDGASGEWVDKPNYFDVTVWGAQGENCARYLAKGRGVAVDGRLEWREWESDGRQALRDRHHRRHRAVPRRRSGRGRRRRQQARSFTPQSDVPVDTSDFATAPAGGSAPVRGRHSVLGPAPWQDALAAGGADAVAAGRRRRRGLMRLPDRPEPLTDRANPVPSTLCASRAIRRAFLTP